MRTARKSNAPRFIKGGFNAKGLRFGIVVSQFNEFLTARLLDGALDTLKRHGALGRDIHVVHVPGAFEIPLALKRLASSKKLDAMLTLAVIIRGDTKHFDQVTQEAARGAQELALRLEIPVILGMIPAETAEQAVKRVGVKQINKGREWALAAIEMAHLLKHGLKRKKKLV
ncbi:MAG TPA: 6,7-dimethyl-8-ribityllumazine synthase [Candidatus Omnitrophota bacterium]|nr:6,7-dimethyl-8-ribityllumazine synthase [Candidatus Omnitrophota bacterium]